MLPSSNLFFPFLNLVFKALINIILVENIEKLNIRVSQNIRDTSKLEIGDEIEVNGKLSYDNFLRQYIVKNIRKVTKN